MDGVKNGVDGGLLEEARTMEARLLNDLEAVRKFIALLERNKAPAASSSSRNSGADVYEGLGVQDGVEMFLAQHPGRRFQACEVANALQNESGFRVTSRSLRTQVVGALKRAVDKGVADQRMKGKRPVYFLKKKGSES